jgi:hypothetical protein
MILFQEENSFKGLKIVRQTIFHVSRDTPS